MKFFKSFLTFVAVATVLEVDGKIWRNCELARVLANAGVSRTFISNYVCLAGAVSGSDTKKVSQISPTVTEYGIFQISDKEFCGKNGRAGGTCNLKCDDLIDEDITDDIQCAKKVQTLYGFKNWKRWGVKCKISLPNLHNCGHKK